MHNHCICTELVMDRILRTIREGAPDTCRLKTLIVARRGMWRRRNLSTSMNSHRMQEVYLVSLNGGNVMLSLQFFLNFVLLLEIECSTTMRCVKHGIWVCRTVGIISRLDNGNSSLTSSRLSCRRYFHLMSVLREIFIYCFFSFVTHLVWFRCKV